MEIKSIEELEIWIQKTESFFLYGAGKVCRKVLQQIEHSGKIKNIQGILVTDIRENVTEIRNIEVVEWAERKEWVEVPILVAVSPLYKNEIVQKLENEYTHKIAWLSNDFESLLDRSIERHRICELKKTIDILEAKIEAIAQSGESESEKKDVLLVSPPFWDVYAPFSAVPCLVAQLKEKGIRVEQCDVGINCIHQIIKKRWKEMADYLSSCTYYEDRVVKYEKNKYCTYEDYKNSLWFFEGDSFSVNLVKAEYLKMNAVQKSVIDAFFQGMYSFAVTNIDFDVCNSIVNEVEQYLQIDFWESLYSENVRSIFANIPPVVGISITSTGQFIPGCILARLFKKCRPDVKIVFGGSCVDIFIKSNYEKKSDIYQYFDYIIIGEGETALVNLIKYLNGKEDWESIPNMVVISEDEKINFSELIIEDVNDLPAPDYEGLDFQLYLAPQLVLPYQTSRGCHYGYCAFCNHDEKYRHHYRTKNVKKVINEILMLSRKYDTQYIQFVDEAIRPDYFREMIEEMSEHDEFKSMKWFFYSRVSNQYDKDLLNKAYDCGCKMVMLGVESFNQRLLNFIKKGINAEVSKKCLMEFHDSGIKTFAWLMCNLPSETLEEAREDLNEVKRMNDYIDAFSVGPFFLDKNTDMYLEPEKFNIVSVDEKDPFRFQSHNNGILIDKEEMLKFCQIEYQGYQNTNFLNGNRYTLFFS